MSHCSGGNSVVEALVIERSTINHIPGPIMKLAAVCMLVPWYLGCVFADGLTFMTAERRRKKERKLAGQHM
jgi:hypothetical protein